MDAKEQKILNKLREDELVIIQKIDQQIQKGLAGGAEHIRLMQKKNVLGDKLNAILDITAKNIKKVGDGMADLTKDSQITQKLFSSLVSSSKTFGKNNQFAAAQAKANQQYGQGVTDNLTRGADAQKRIQKLNKQQVTIGSVTEKLRDSLITSYETEIGLANNALSVYRNIGDEALEIQKAEANRGSQLMESISTSYAEEALAKSKHQLAANMHKLTGKALIRAQASVREQVAALNILKEQAAVQQLQIDQRDAMTDAIVGPFEKMKGVLEGLPGGGMLSKAMGLDAFGSELNKIVGKSIQVGLAGGAKAGVAHFKSLTSQSKIFGTVLNSSLLPILGLAAILIGAIMLFKNMSKQTEDI